MSKSREVQKSQVGDYIQWKVGGWRVMKKPGSSEPYTLSCWELGAHITMTCFLDEKTPELAILAILHRISGMEFYTSLDSILKPFYIKKWPV